MLSFALKNLATKKVQAILVLFSILLSAGVALLAYNTAAQVSDGIASGAAYYGAIVGPAGSSTQLAMNTMYFTDEPLGTLPYALLSELRRDQRVTEAIPFAMADSYNGYSVVGTAAAYLDGKETSDGRLFSDDATFEAVLGATVAKTCGVSVGDQIYTSHAVGEEHTQPFTVVGILAETHTSFDAQVFTELRTIWEVHEHEEEEHEEEHDHEDMDKMLCAVLVKTKNPTFAATIVNDYNGKVFTDPASGEPYSLQAIEPMAAVRSVLQDADNTKYIVFVLCAVILLLNIVIITIITWLNMVNSRKEIALMRLIGIGMGKVKGLYLLQNGLIGLCGAILAFGLSRLCMVFMKRYVASMGVVLDTGKIYPMEFVILAGVFVISILPTLICVGRMAKQDGLGE